MYTHITILYVHLFTSFCMYTHTTILYVHLFTSFCMYTHTTILYVHTYLINIVCGHELPTSDPCEHTLTIIYSISDKICYTHAVYMHNNAYPPLLYTCSLHA